MSHDPHHSQPNNTYVINSESAAEMARLMRQDQLITLGMGGLFPEGIDLTDVQSILDVACGPGGWVLETAFTHKNIEVIGIDISHKMINYAQAQAEIQGRKNAHFYVMNALQSFDFPDQSFDIINARLLTGFMLPEVWPSFLRECFRILRPGGIIRLTELEWGFTNKKAFEHMCSLFSKSLHVAGQSFSPNGTHLGIIPMLPRLIKQAGYEQVRHLAHVLNFSWGTEAHEGFYHDLASAFKLVQPFITKWKVASQDELNQTYEQMLLEMQEEDFCSMWILLTVWGFKPLS